jgi:adenine-specific DNA-methyltransferase
VIAQNKEDGDQGKRKFVLVEMGTYFDTVLKPRIQKVMYSLNWREGQPIADQVDGYQGIVKVQRLEQYEDLLANLETAWDDETLPKGLPVQYLFRPDHNKLVASLDLCHPFTQTIKAGKAREEKTIDLMESWLYLQGYWVKSRRRYIENGRKYLAVETTIGVLIIFRNIDTGEDDSAVLNAIVGRYTGDSGEPTVTRLEVNFDADIRTVKLPVTLVQAADFDRGASWS